MNTAISARPDRTLWVQCACTAVVAIGAIDAAGNASYNGDHEGMLL